MNGYPLADRIQIGASNPLYALREIRENTLSDIVGWVRPDQSPPINGRTFKELKMLGYPLQSDSLEADGPGEQNRTATLGA